MEDRAVVGGTSFRQEGRIYCTSDGTLKGGTLYQSTIIESGIMRLFVRW
jgi:hypothetical protein